MVTNVNQWNIRMPSDLIKWFNRYDIAPNSSANGSAIDKVMDMEITNAVKMLQLCMSVYHDQCITCDRLLHTICI